MVNQITLSVPDTELAESLVNCKVGEEKTVTFAVTEVAEGRLAGNVTSVEDYGSEAEETEDEGVTEEDAMPAKSGMHGGRKMPRAIIMIGAGK